MELTKVNNTGLKKPYLELMNEHVTHQEHRQWLSQLDFYEDEIRIFRRELLGVVQMHPDYFYMVEHVDEYRAILLRKLEHIDQLRHQIILQERKLIDKEVSNTNDHEALRHSMETFVQNFEEMKTSFRRFVAHND